MDFLAYVGIVFFAALFIHALLSRSNEKRKVFKNNVYSYTAKSSVMTRAESEFFKTLENAVNERYYVFPQVHLSALLDHKVNGQEWKYAFSHINGKSVDFVLCSRDTLLPTYAIELDDYTHDYPDRKERDKEVQRILDQANIPLVRFANNNTSGTDIIEALAQSRS